MNRSRSYEYQVGDYFKRRGYDVKVTPSTNDWGVDCFASKGKDRIAIQAKNYGTGRPVNRKMLMELFGAMHYFDCNRAILATNGRLRPDAKKVADKLKIEILHIELDETGPFSSEVDETSFEHIWEKHIVPLKGKTLVRADGKTNVIKEVDWGGIKRVTSTGNTKPIDIEIFKQVINRLKQDGTITRKEINEDYLGRASTGICLILSQVPFIEYQERPARLVWKKSKVQSKTP